MSIHQKMLIFFEKNDESIFQGDHFITTKHMKTY